jgi:Na+-driven multidrug efflux pump
MGYHALARSSSLRQEVVRLALPNVAERILSLTVNIINTILVGHLGASALAAVGLSGTIEMVGSSFLMAVGTGPRPWSPRPSAPKTRG